MTAPAIAARRFLISCLLGAALGLYYGFLRPLRPRHTVLADGLFLLGGAGVWVYLGFGVCGGDLRLGYTLGLLAGGILWESGPGAFLRPVFDRFWGFVRRTVHFFVLPGKKILHFA